VKSYIYKTWIVSLTLLIMTLSSPLPSFASEGATAPIASVVPPAASIGSTAPAVSIAPAPSTAPESVSLLMYYGNNEAFLGGVKVQMEAPVIKLKNRTYLPVASLQSFLGIPVQWEASTGSVQVTTPSAYIQLQLSGKQLRVNGQIEDYDKAAFLLNDRLYVELDWINRFVGFKATVNEDLQRVELLYIKRHESGVFFNDTMPNTKPVAKFTVNKNSYRLGEPIIYTNASFDPDGDTIKGIEWTGNAEAIFQPGLFKVSLSVTDSKGTVSDPFSYNVEIVDEPYLDEFVYKVYHEPVGTYVKEEEKTLRAYLRGIPQLPNIAKLDKDRPLIVSDSPETFTEKGFLYQEKVNGKARLYADHVNGMKEKVQFAIIVRNPSPDKSVTIKTTRHGEVLPSIYANLIGNEASIEFLQSDRSPESITVGPYQTIYYKKMPEFYPDQGMNVMYDVETSGEVYFSFVAMDPGVGIESVGMYKQLPYAGNVRGTFSGSDVSWEVDASGLTKPSSLAIGDGTSDIFVTGSDFYEKEKSLNLGNYGVIYKIHIPNPPKMSLLVLPRGGVFRGPFEINGTIIQAPPSGIMMDYQGYTILARTDGTEPSLDIEFTPAAGSAFPVDIIFYPLEDK
jgi:hypothetical protein